MIEAATNRFSKTTPFFNGAKPLANQIHERAYGLYNHPPINYQLFKAIRQNGWNRPRQGPQFENDLGLFYMQKTTFLGATDAFLKNERGEILMIRRHQDKAILPGFYNGLGGRMERGETPPRAIRRELREEAGTDTAHSLQLKSILTVDDKFGSWQIFIFIGVIKKTAVKKMTIAEGQLEWITSDNLKNKKLVPDLKAWIDLLWQEEKLFFVKAVYDEHYSLIKNSINIL